MTDKGQEHLDDELFGTRMGELRDATGPTKGEFVPPPPSGSPDKGLDVLFCIPRSPVQRECHLEQP